MELNMRTAMLDAWREWHGYMAPEDVPSVNPSFERGFVSAVDVLMPLLEMAAPHVFASAGAHHMLDGFRPQRKPIDELVERIKSALPTVEGSDHGHQ